MSNAALVTPWQLNHPGLTKFVQEGNFNPPHNIESIQHFRIKLTSLDKCWSGCPDNLAFVIVRSHRVAPKTRAKQRKSSTTKALSNAHNIAHRYQFNTFEGASESLNDVDYRGVSCQLSWQIFLAVDGYVRRDMLHRTVIVRSHCNSAMRTTTLYNNNNNIIFLVSPIKRHTACCFFYITGTVITLHI